MRRDDGLVLPDSLSGEIVERTIKIDRSLLYIVSGALEWITDYQRYEEVGAYTVDDARSDLADMLYYYFSGETSGAKMYAGMLQMWTGNLPLPSDLTDDGWLLCDGDTLPEADYPDLYAVIGDKWTNGGEPSGEFRLPDFGNRLPMGTTFNAQVGNKAGSDSVALSIANLPPHTHTVPRASSSPAGSGSSVAATGSVATTNVTGSTGSGTAFSILNPVAYVGMIIMSRNP